jgi:hypothetical protein
MRSAMALVLVSFLLVSGVGAASAQGWSPTSKISRDLAELMTPPMDRAAAATPGGWAPVPLVVTGDSITIDAIATGDPAALEADLVALGAVNTAIAGHLVSAQFPIAAIPVLESLASLRFARPAHRTNNVGRVTSQGDAVMRSDLARTQFGIDGTGVLVGVLSDSYNCLFGAATDIAFNDLPAGGVTVIQDDPGCGSGTDEGRAMLQIVHDVAPGSPLAFATAEGGQANFAANIRALRNGGAKVIVDDVIYFAEPMFQDGIIAQAVDDVVGTGVAYFSSAGNAAKKAYDHTFVPGTPLASGIYGFEFLGGTPHNFSAGMPRQTVSGPFGSQFTMVLQWDQPFFSVSGAPGNQDQVDVYLLSASGASFSVVFAETVNVVGGDPVQIMGPVQCFGSSCVGYIMIVSRSGTPPGRFKYSLFTRGPATSFSPALNAGTIYGHANAQGAMAVGASSYKTPTTIEVFSSSGTTPVLFDTDGSLLNPADPRAFKPEIVAPDGADTSFFGSDSDGTGFPNFFGTSAAAPHAAGVAALLRQALPSLDPDGIRSVLETTAQNMGAAGFDTTTGFGLIHADSALNALHTLAITSGPTGTPNPVVPGGDVNLTSAASDSFGHTITSAWTSTCTGGITTGTFDNAAAQNPTWTAGANATGTTQTCTLKLTITDGHGSSKFGTLNVTVLSVPKVTSLTPVTGPVGTNVTIMGMGFTGATSATFTGASSVTVTAVTATSLHAIVPAGAQSGVVSVTNAAGTGASTTIFKVSPKITSVSPPSVNSGSGATITVNGFNLKVGGTTPTVKIGALVVPSGSITSNATQITFPLPAGALTGKVMVTTVDGSATSASDLIVVLPPKPASFVPAMGAVGTEVVINGTSMAGSNLVIFSNNVSVSPTLVTATSLHAVVPIGAVTGNVSVFNSAGSGTTAAIFKVLPKISSFTPGAAVGGSGATITVNGFNLKIGGTTPAVKVGAVAVPTGSITSSSPTQLTFPLPTGATTGKISVTTADGTGTSGTDFIVILPPKPMSFLPAAATVGTDIVINGTQLAGSTLVTFTGPVSVTATAATATSLHAIVPAGALSGNVSISNPAGSGTTTAIFKVLPKITGFAPGTAVGGSATTITVNGFNLKVGATTPTVRIGAFVVPSGSITSSSTQVSFPVPLGAVTGKIMITTVDGTATSATDLTVQQPPRAVSFAPAAAMVGAGINITGTNLTGANLVTFTGGATALPTAVTATTLHVVVPDNALTGPVTVTNPTGSAPSAASFKVLPKITGFTPGAAVGGSGATITVNGFNLKVGSTTPTVKVGAVVVPAVSITSSLTQITFPLPATAVTGKIVVTTTDGSATSGTGLIVILPPKPTSFAPASAAVGTDIVISGTQLAGSVLVTFTGPVSVTATAATATSLHVVVPAGALSGNVSVTNPAGTGTTTAIFKVLPKITSFNPPSPVGGSGATITVTGTNLKVGSTTPTVKIGAVVVPAASIIMSTLTQISFPLPATAVTGKIMITTADGTATSASDLVVVLPPHPTSFVPTAAAAGTDIVINGTALAGSTLVTFTGGETASPTSVTATSLHVTVPAGALSGNVSVTNPAGTGTTTAIFKVLPKITGFNPASGAVGAQITVDGTNLKIGATNPVVKIGAKVVTTFTATDLQVVLTIPAGAVTGKITITTADGTATSATNLTVTP